MTIRTLIYVPLALRRSLNRWRSSEHGGRSAKPNAREKDLVYVHFYFIRFSEYCLLGLSYVTVQLDLFY